MPFSCLQYTLKTLGQCPDLATAISTMLSIANDLVKSRPAQENVIGELESMLRAG